MNSKDIKLLYSALGAFMLVLLQTTVFQNALMFLNLIGIPYLGDIALVLINMLSCVGVIVFIISSVKLIKNNIKFKNE
ncbi:hypothetical protein K5V21_01215 [Clostridium sardiniense]|uniref:Uncharacterized protein n=1 Tax=Clostridium sardiniense TaxID=29369 RepID=A0ABS7KTC6_CLOSR|nr:hypothetical protein [Clostridium sardiniense]MBY0754064.1 hypothetical protein [Clostridium sardiniense]MDQ0459416.1 hypothetical protein [Clostridium sardiniense]